MSSIIHITDNSGKALEELKSACNRALESCGQTAEGYAKARCPVDTGALRNSISHKVDESYQACDIGTDMEYAPYVELGTGKYYSGGRKTPWVYRDYNGNYHYTEGQKAQPYLKPALADHTSTYKSIIESELKRG